MSATSGRHPYQGVFQILQFNWRFYLATVTCISAALIASLLLPSQFGIALRLSAIPALFWLGSSLLVSHYVYDRFPLYDLTWISRALSCPPQRWINIHCGLDETSDLLAAVFPDATGQVVDIFDPLIMTEASIRQAQGIHRGATPALRAHYYNLIIPAGSFDAAFVLFAAHELRRHDQRVTLFQEIARALEPGGELVLMEHSRDWWNFLAFGPGFLHFFSKPAWRKAIFGAGFALRCEFSMTPFVHVYILRRSK